MARTPRNDEPRVEDYRHEEAQRLNNPEAGLVADGVDCSPPAAGVLQAWRGLDEPADPRRLVAGDGLPGAGAAGGYGSIFVQISDENLHRVRAVMDEVFGSENLESVITFSKTSGFSPTLLSNVVDYLLRYARDRSKMRFRQPYMPKTLGLDGATQYTYIASRLSGEIATLTDDPHAQEDRWRVLAHGDMNAQGSSGNNEPVSFEAALLRPAASSHWKTTPDGMTRLGNAGRFMLVGSSLRYKRYLEDLPIFPLANVWTDTSVSGFSDKKQYVVQTSPLAIQRCLLMTTDPGDLVLVPTCVRAGTGVWWVGEEAEAPLWSPRQRGDGGGGRGDDGSVTAPSTLAPSPLTGRAGEGSAGEQPAPRPATPLWSPRQRGDGGGGQGDEGSVTAPSTLAPSPLTGRAGEGSLRAIDTLQPGDLVLAHDGRPHRVTRVIAKRHGGPMVGLRTGPDQTLWLTADHRVLCRKRTAGYGARRDWSHVPRQHFERARELRRELTAMEQRLWSRLRRGELGAKFRKQHPLGPYILDFYSFDAGLVIEVDGDSHFTPEAEPYDAERDRYLRGHGLTILRFTNAEVHEDLESVVEHIHDAIAAVSPADDPDRQWRRADTLQPGDIVFHGPDLRPVEVAAVAQELTDETVYDLEVEGAHSFVTAVCCVHNCGSGTTAYVAEQWGRRWITMDTNRVAVACYCPSSTGGRPSAAPRRSTSRPAARVTQLRAATSIRWSLTRAGRTARRSISNTVTGSCRTPETSSLG